MKKLFIMALFLTVVTVGCSKNYYSGSGKKGGDCGCPSKKGMVGY